EQITRPKDRQQLVEWGNGARDVHHHGQANRLAYLDGPLQRGEVVGPRILGPRADLDAEDDVPVALDGPDRLVDIGELEVHQFVPYLTDHPGDRDVQHRTDAGRLYVDDVLAEPREGLGTGGARVHHRRGAAGHMVPVRLDPVVRDTLVDVDVRIDEAGSHDATGRIDDGARATVTQVGGDRGDLPVENADVVTPVEPLTRVDELSAADEQVENLCAPRSRDPVDLGHRRRRRRRPSHGCA